MGDYWERRYTLGGTSGRKSVRGREWIWDVNNSILSEVDHVIDVSCGDLTFWEGRSCNDYIGIDISETVIKENRKKRPEWRFIASRAQTPINGLKNDCVFCFGLLYHIMETEAFIAILRNLCRYSTKYIFIYTWMRNPLTKPAFILSVVSSLFASLLRRQMTVTRDYVDILKNVLTKQYTDGRYQYFRSLEQYMDIFKVNNFSIILKKENPNNIGALYIFKKVG